jgi:hypothetical protein
MIGATNSLLDSHANVVNDVVGREYGAGVHRARPVGGQNDDNKRVGGHK